MKEMKPVREMKKNKNGLSIVVPAYNEKNSLAKLVYNLKTVMDNTSYKYEIIIVDDGSTDGSKKVLEKLKQKELKVIYNINNKGYGCSLKIGIDAAENNLIIMMDADGTYLPEEIPRMLRYHEKYDMVSGARVGKNVKIPLLRKPAKFILKSFAVLLVGKNFPDLNCGMRLIKKDNVKKFFNILPQRFSFTTTHLLACLSNEDAVKFIPIRYKRRKGVSTIHPIKDFIRFFNIIIRIITYFKPFKMFSLFSLATLLMAMFIFFISLLIFDRIADISVIVLIMSSVQIFLFGLLADLIVKKNS
jgi:glycosyltransferase involved in cell wall biosynthesis